MRIGIDMLSIQAAGARGRGFAAQARLLVAGLLSTPGDHEFILYAHEWLPLDGIPSGPRATMARPLDRGEATVTHRLEQLAASNPDHLDWLLIPDPFDAAYDVGPPSRPLNGLKMAGVLHDLGPVLFPDRATAGPEAVERAARALTRLRSYDLLLAASETTRSDALGLLSLPPDRIGTIGAAADPAAFAPDVTVPRSLAARRELHRLGVRRAFILFDAKGDGPPGVARRLDAFGALPDGLRNAYQLILSGLPGEREAARAREAARDRGWADADALAEPIDEPSMRVLLQHCAAFVSPSRYDGLGASVLEAMLCGAVIIAGNTSAPAELLGEAGLLVDPLDPAEIAGRLSQALDDWTLAQALRSKAVAHVRRFNAGRVADAAREAIERATRPRSTARFRIDRGHGPKPRVAVLAPLPPKGSGIADYSARLIDELKATYTIDVYHDHTYVPDLALSARDVACHDARLFDRNDAVIDYHAVLYQMGNCVADHGYVHDRLGDRPGVVTLHDFFLSAYPYRNARTRPEILDAYRRAIVEYCPDRAGEFVPHLDGWCEEEGGLSAACARRGLFLNRRAFENAASVVVHSPWCLEQVRAWLPEHAEKTVVIPMGTDPSGRAPSERDAIRDRFGLGRDALVVACFGFVVPDKMVVEALDAFRSVLRREPSAVFVVAGEEADDGAARRASASLGLGDRARFLGRLPAADFDDLIAVTDLGVNLRRPPGNGETSAALLKLLAAGVPTVVTEVGTAADYPDHVVCKVRWESGGIIGLRHAMLDLATDRAARAALGRAAGEHIRTQHTWRRAATLYVEQIERCAAARRRGNAPRVASGRRPHSLVLAKESR